MDPEAFRGKKVILFRTDRLGDLILSFPVIEALKAWLPETEVHLVVNPAAVPLARAHSGVSQVFPDVYQGPAGLRSLVRVLADPGYRLALHLYPRPLQSAASFAARVPERAGSAYRYYSALYNHRVRLHRKHMTTHERDLNLQVLESLGIPATRTTPGFFPTQRALADVGRLLVRHGLPSLSHPFVVIHPGSGGSSLNWPAEHYGVLAARLAASGLQVVLTGTEFDRPTVESVRRSGGGLAWDLCGMLDLEHLTALVSLASLVVSNSTGPLHLADALGRKVIGLFSRHFYASPRRWGPYSQSENVFQPSGDPCPRCTRDRCREYNCMASISPEDVLDRSQSLLGTKPPRNGTMSMDGVQGRAEGPCGSSAGGNE